MPKVERDVVKRVNESSAAGNRANNGFLPLSRESSQVHPPNEAHKGGCCRGGSANLAKNTSPVHPPDHRFKIEEARMPNPPSAFEPGKGAIPVNPSVPGGHGINRVYPEADLPKPKK
jgi:hypothetical protein